MANDKIVLDIVECIKQRLEPNERDRVQQDSVERILASLVDDASPHYYVDCVRSWSVDVPEETLKFGECSLALKHAESVFPCLHEACCDLLPDNKLELKNIFCEYMACKRDNQAGEQERAHVDIIKHSEFMEILKQHVLKADEAKSNETLKKLGTVLGLSYWLYVFFSRKEDKKHGNYEKYRSLHNFLTDLIISLVGLICFLGIPPTYRSSTLDGTEIPPFHKIVPHICISPVHSAFQREILKRMFAIIVPNNQIDGTPEEMAQHFCQKFGESPWMTRGHSGVLQIVKDQSRYLSLGSKELRRNYVAHKTKTCASMILELQHAASEVQNIFEMEKGDTLTEEKCLKWQYEIHSCMCSPGKVNYSHFPALPRVGGRLLPKRDKIKKALNSFHHQLLHNIAVCILKRKNIPPLNKENRYITNDFMKFVRELARSVIKEKPPPEDLSSLVVSLQLIIGVRWFESEAVMRATIELDSDAREHQDVLFLFMAFRSILMYMLPIVPPKEYHVQQVSRTLPDYARNIKFGLHLS